MESLLSQVLRAQRLVTADRLVVLCARTLNVWNNNNTGITDMLGISMAHHNAVRQHREVSKWEGGFW